MIGIPIRRTQTDHITKKIFCNLQILDSAFYLLYRPIQILKIILLGFLQKLDLTCGSKVNMVLSVLKCIIQCSIYYTISHLW